MTFSRKCVRYEESEWSYWGRNSQIIKLATSTRIISHPYAEMVFHLQCWSLPSFRRLSFCDSIFSKIKNPIYYFDHYLYFSKKSQGLNHQRTKKIIIDVWKTNYIRKKKKKTIGIVKNATLTIISIMCLHENCLNGNLRTIQNIKFIN